MANVIKLKNSGTANTAPTSLEVGELAVNYNDGILYYKNSSNAISILSSAASAIAAGSSIAISTTPPVSPSSGDLWFDSDTAQTFVYYDSFWVEIGSSGMAAVVSDAPPSSPIAGQIWFNSVTGGTYVYYSSAWAEIGAVPDSVPLNVIDAKGDLIVGTADNVAAKLSAGTDGYFLKANSSTATGLAWAAIPTINALDDVGDVTITSISTGQFLKWDGSAWVNATIPTINALDDIGDVTITSASSGQVLQWNGSVWINATVSSDVMTDTRNAALIIMDIGV
jgi:hypothetical protein